MVSKKIQYINYLLSSEQYGDILEQSINDLFQSILTLSFSNTSSTNSSTNSSSSIDSTASFNELTSIVQIIKVSCSKNTNILPVFISYLPLIHFVDPFLDIIPSIFSISSDHLIEEVFQILAQLIESDNEKTLKIISILMDLPLLPHLQSQVALIAFDSLQSVDEIDIPPLCRTILKNLTNDSSSMIQEIRKQVFFLLFRFFLVDLTSFFRSPHFLFQVYLS